MSARGRRSKRSQFMARRAKRPATVEKTPAKRPRNHRIASYLPPAEHARFERYQNRLGCNASHIVRMAVLGLLDGVEPNETGAALEAAADRERWRQIAFRLMWLLQAVHWAPLMLSPGEPLEKHFDAAAASNSMALIEPELRTILRRIAELLAPPQVSPPPTSPVPGNDASRAETDNKAPNAP